MFCKFLSVHAFVQLLDFFLQRFPPLFLDFYFTLIGLFVCFVSVLYYHVSLEQYRQVIGSFNTGYCGKLNSSLQKCNTCNITQLTIDGTGLLVLLSLLLVLANDVETNPGSPTKICPACKS